MSCVHGLHLDTHSFSSSKSWSFVCLYFRVLHESLEVAGDKWGAETDFMGVAVSVCVCFVYSSGFSFSSQVDSNGSIKATLLLQQLIQSTIGLWTHDDDDNNVWTVS